MSTTVAELVARLRADTSEFSGGIDRANADLDRLGKESGRSSENLSRLGGVATAVGSAVGVSFAAAAASLAQVGISYNTLLQKSTAAMTTILGTRQAANGMIQDLTTFARSSPFPRQAFIAGAQQLTGFGVAAKNIIPIFGAIQDAVAATGGGAEQIARFTEVFSQMKSMGRATTIDLMRLGETGVDAFKIIADQSGKSVEEVRAQVSNGMLKSDQAIKMLTDGMEKRFAGAAANVKDTWVGATDRVKGAWRDMASAMLTPFINPQGGGAAVKWANELADVLRMLEKQVIVPLGEQLTKFFDKMQVLTDKFNITAHVQSAINTLKEFQGQLATLAPAIGLVTAALGMQGLERIPFVGELAKSIPFFGPFTGGLIGMALSSKDSRDALFSLAGTLKDGLMQLMPAAASIMVALTGVVAALVPPLVQLVQGPLTQMIPALVSLAQTAAVLIVALTPAIEMFARFLSTIASSPAVIYALVAAFAAWKSVEMISWIGGVVDGLKTMIGLAAQVTSLGDAHAALSLMVGKSAAASTEAKVAQEGLSGAVAAFNPLTALAAAGVGIATGVYMEWIHQKDRLKKETQDLTKAVLAEADAVRYLTEGKGARRTDSSGLDSFNTVLSTTLSGKQVAGGDSLVSTLTGLGITMSSLSKGTLDAGESFHKFADNLASSGAAGVEVNTKFAQGMGTTLEQITHSASSMAPIVRQLFDAWHERKIDEKQLQSIVKLLDDTTIATKGAAEAAKTQAKANKDLETANLAELFTKVNAGIAAQAALIAPLKDQWAGLWNASNDYADAADRVNKELTKALDPWNAYAEAQKRVSAVNKDGVASVQNWLDTMANQDKAVASWTANLDKIALKHKDLAKYLADKGVEAAPLVATISGLNEAKTDELWAGIKKHTETGIAATTANLISGLSVWPDIMNATGTKTREQAAAVLRLTPDQVNQMQSQAGLDFGKVMAAYLAQANVVGPDTQKAILKALGDIDQSAYQGIKDKYKSLLDGIFKDRAKVTIPLDIAIDASFLVNNPQDLTNTVAATVAAATGGNLHPGGSLPHPPSGWGGWHPPVSQVNGGVLSFADGIEDHVAQIAPGGALRVWAEPETGGEAYIPLADAKRGRSMDILGSVASRFGMRLEKFAIGSVPDMPWDGVEIPDPQHPGKKKRVGGRGGSGSGSSVDFKAIQAMQDTMNSVGDMSDADYAALLDRRIANETKYTADWKSQWDKRKSMQDKEQAEVKAYFDSINAAAAAKAAFLQSIYDQEKQVQDNMHTLGVMSNTDYLAKLQDRLSGLKAFSNEWTSTWQQIAAITQKAVDDASAQLTKAQAGVTTFVASLKAQETSLVSSMKTIYDGIANTYTGLYEAASKTFAAQDKPIEAWSAKFSSAITGVANAVSAFSSTKFISGEMVNMFFDQHLAQAKDFKTIMDSLASSGLDTGLLRTLAESGPKSIELAKGLQEAVKAGDTAKINAAIVSFKDLGSTFADTAKKFGSGGSDIFPVPPIPQYKSFNEILATEIATLKDGEAVRAKAVQYGQDMASVLVQQNGEYQKLSGQLKTVRDTLAEVYTKFPDEIQQTKSLAEQWRAVADAVNAATAALAAAKGAQKAEKDKVEALRGKPEDVAGFLQSVYDKEQAAHAQAIQDPAVAAYLDSLYNNGIPHAKGGTVASGMTYLVGENGPELFRSGSGGSIIPNDAMGGGKSISVDAGAIQVTINGNADQSQVSDAISAAMDDLVERLARLLEDQ